MHDVRQQGPDKPVSSVLDNWRNQIDRYEDERGIVTLRIKVAPGSPKTAAQVEAWYWQHVGVSNAVYSPCPPNA